MYYGGEISGFHPENFCDSKVQILVAYKWFVSMLWLNLQWFITDVLFLPT